MGGASARAVAEGVLPALAPSAPSSLGASTAWRLRQWRYSLQPVVYAACGAALIGLQRRRGARPRLAPRCLLRGDGPNRGGGTTPGDGPRLAVWHYDCHRGRDRPGAARWAAAGQVSSRAPPCVCRVPPGRRSDRIALRGTRTRWHVPRGTAVHQSSMSGTPIRFAFRESRRDRRYRARAPRIATRAIDISSSKKTLKPGACGAARS